MLPPLQQLQRCTRNAEAPESCGVVRLLRVLQKLCRSVYAIDSLSKKKGAALQEPIRKPGAKKVHAIILRSQYAEVAFTLDSLPFNGIRRPNEGQTPQLWYGGPA